jgi:anaerobic selenocysteine-containing dehydrogenase
VADLKVYKCRKEGTKRWIADEYLDPVDAASCFAEEHGLEDGDIVEVNGPTGGRYRVSVRTEVEVEKI